MSMDMPSLFLLLSLLARVTAGVRGATLQYIMDIMEDMFLGWLSNNMEGAWVSTISDLIAYS